MQNEFQTFASSQMAAEYLVPFIRSFSAGEFAEFGGHFAFLIDDNEYHAVLSVNDQVRTAQIIEGRDDDVGIPVPANYADLIECKSISMVVTFRTIIAEIAGSDLETSIIRGITDSLSETSKSLFEDMMGTTKQIAKTFAHVN